MGPPLLLSSRPALEAEGAGYVGAHQACPGLCCWQSPVSLLFPRGGQGAHRGAQGSTRQQFTQSVYTA